MPGKKTAQEMQEIVKNYFELLVENKEFFSIKINSLFNKLTTVEKEDGSMMQAFSDASNNLISTYDDIYKTTLCSTASSTDPSEVTLAFVVSGSSNYNHFALRNRTFVDYVNNLEEHVNAFEDKIKQIRAQKEFQKAGQSPYDGLDEVPNASESNKGSLSSKSGAQYDTESDGHLVGVVDVPVVVTEQNVLPEGKKSDDNGKDNELFKLISTVQTLLNDESAFGSDGIKASLDQLFLNLCAMKFTGYINRKKYKETGEFVVSTTDGYNKLSQEEKLNYCLLEKQPNIATMTPVFDEIEAQLPTASTEFNLWYHCWVPVLNALIYLANQFLSLVSVTPIEYAFVSAAQEKYKVSKIRPSVVGLFFPVQHTEAGATGTPLVEPNGKLPTTIPQNV